MNVVRSQEESPIVLQKQSNMMKEDRQAGKYFLSFSQIYFFFRCERYFMPSHLNEIMINFMFLGYTL